MTRVYSLVARSFIPSIACLLSACSHSALDTCSAPVIADNSDARLIEPATTQEAGLRCATAAPSDDVRAVVHAQFLEFQRTSAVARDGGVNIVVPVRVIVIHDGCTGKLSLDQVQAQIDALNRAYTRYFVSFLIRPTPGNAAHGDVTWVNSPRLFKMNPPRSSAAPQMVDGKLSCSESTPTPEELEAKKKYGKDTERCLNIYFVEPADHRTLGWSTWPWCADANATTKILDGVVINWKTVPGVQRVGRFSQGKTAVHEIGHYLGLYHTFQGGCSEPGDYVNDTPPQDEPGTGQPLPGPHCAGSPNSSPFNNYMDYVDDPAMTEFTPGQIARMRAMVDKYRQWYVASD